MNHFIKKSADCEHRAVQNLGGGNGTIEIIPLLSENEMKDKCRVFSDITVKAGCSIGYHLHHGESETYYILSGVGIYNDNGIEKVVKEGDITFTPDGCGHGLTNNGMEDIRLIALIIRD